MIYRNAWPMLAAVAMIVLTSCKDEKLSKSRSDFDYIEMNNKLGSVTEIADFIKPYHDSIEGNLNKVLSYSKIELWANRKGVNSESPLGNLLSDLVFEQANERYKNIFNKEIDFAVLNRNGIRTSIGKGDITLREMFEIMPFENTLLVVTIGPEKMKEFLNYMANSRSHPMANIKLTIKDKEAINVSINGKAYDDKKSYKIVTTDYLQHGGDRMYFFSNPISIDTLNYKMRDAMIDYFEKTDTVEVNLDGRFNYAK